MDLYNETCFECSKVVTEKYSTSFSSGIKAFHERFHYPIYAIYGFVRYADEIVDTFADYDKEKLLRQFSNDTFEAIDNGISLNPVLHSFQQIVRRYQIDAEHIECFLSSMFTDLDQTRHNSSSYKAYIFGSAEVVGLMCLRVFCEGNDVLYRQLEPYAKCLGSAFQKVNFLRDIQSDFEDRGRVYFPGVDFVTFSEQEKTYIQDDIKREFDYALQGVKLLPPDCRKGVYIAFCYYSELLRKIESTSAEALSKTRIRISDGKKIWLLAQAMFKYRFKMI